MYVLFLEPRLSESFEHDGHQTQTKIKQIYEPFQLLGKCENNLKSKLLRTNKQIDEWSVESANTQNMERVNANIHE